MDCKQSGWNSKAYNHLHYDGASGSVTAELNRSQISRSARSLITVPYLAKLHIWQTAGYTLILPKQLMLITNKSSDYIQFAYLLL